jgi:hypothetical protein
MPVTEKICMEFKLTRRILAKQFSNHTHSSVWETLAQCTEIARIGALFEAYTGEQSWNSTGDTLIGPCYLSTGDHVRKIKPGNEETISVKKNTLVNRTIKLWNQQPAKALATFPGKTHSFGERFRKVTISEEK